MINQNVITSIYSIQIKNKQGVQSYSDTKRVLTNGKNVVLVMLSSLSTRKLVRFV